MDIFSCGISFIDGRMDILMKQPDGGIDDRYIPHEVRCLTAFSLEGDLLWQVGTPDPGVRGIGNGMRHHRQF